jgi:hypothetical protein
VKNEPWSFSSIIGKSLTAAIARKAGLEPYISVLHVDP